jgi:hypothetical protein
MLHLLLSKIYGLGPKLKLSVIWGIEIIRNMEEIIGNYRET